VEGDGDALAVPVLVKQLLTELDAWQHVTLDDPPFKVGNVAEITRGEGKEWIRLLKAAQKKPPLGGVLLVQDGELGRIRNEEFVTCRFATRLAEWSKAAGAGSLFSVAVVFACTEFESWLIACADRLAGQKLTDGRPGIVEGTTIPPGDLEQSPRDAKR